MGGRGTLVLAIKVMGRGGDELQPALLLVRMAAAVMRMLSQWPCGTSRGAQGDQA